MLAIKLLSVFLLISASSQNARPFKAFAGSDSGCTLPDPKVSASCLSGMSSKQSQLKQCSESKLNALKSQIQKDAGNQDTTALNEDVCCGIHSVLSCLDMLKVIFMNL